MRVCAEAAKAQTLLVVVVGVVVDVVAVNKKPCPGSHVSLLQTETETEREAVGQAQREGEEESGRQPCGHLNVVVVVVVVALVNAVRSREQRSEPSTE